MVLNVPNCLTLARLLLIPVFAYALLSDTFALRWVAAVAFAVAALTDWFDGFLARKLNQVTEFGKIADPFVDRLLILSAVVIIYLKVSDLIPLWAALLLIGRDALIVFGGAYLARSGRRLDVAYAGKLATAILMGAFFTLFIGILLPSGSVKAAGVLLFYAGLAVSLYSGLNYVKLGTTVLRSKQAQK